MRCFLAMSPIAAGSFLEAVKRTCVREDRITEVLAAHLGYDADARAAVCAVVGAPEFTGAVVLTQREIPEVGGCVDLELRLTEGDRLYVVWIEVKVGAKEQWQQLDRYARELRHLHGDDSTLVALAGDGDRIFVSAAAPIAFEDGEQRDRTAGALTWQELGNLLDSVGRRRGGLGWRAAKIASRDRADQRLLSDLLTYLEGEGLVNSDDPITTADATVVSRADRLLDSKDGAITRLLRLAGARIPWFADANVKPWNTVGSHGRSVPWPSGWPVELNDGGVTWAQIGLLSSDEDMRSEPRREPVFYAGIAFEPATPPATEALTNPAWGLPARFIVNRWGEGRTARNIFLAKLLYLGELAVLGVTLSIQAEQFGTWAVTAFDELLGLQDPRGVARPDPQPPDTT